MYSLSTRSHGSFFESLSKGRMSVTRPRHVFGTGTIFQCKSSLGNHLAGIGSDDVDTQDAIRLRIGQKLHQTIGIHVRFRSRVGGERERSNLVVDLGFFQFGFILSDPCDFGVRVHDRGNGVVVDVAVILGDEFDCCHGFFFCFVCEHGAECAITDDTNVRDFRSVLRVDDQAAAVVSLDADSFEVEARGVRATADGYEDHVGVELRTRTSVRIVSAAEVGRK